MIYQTILNLNKIHFEGLKNDFIKYFELFLKM